MESWIVPGLLSLQNVDQVFPMLNLVL